MKITNLIENTKGKQDVLFEHGLSFYIETEKHKLLSDCGQTDAFLKNADILGIDLKKVDTVIVSHGHYDHTGGLLSFAAINTHAAVYIQKKALLPYYHKTEKEERYIGIAPEIEAFCKEEAECSAVGENDGFFNDRRPFTTIEGDFKIDEELFLFSNVKGRVLWPEGNLELKKKEGDTFIQDQFDHEQYLVICENGKYFLFSGCAHNGILNILEHFHRLFGMYPNAVVSGFHMKKKEYTKKDDDLIIETAKRLCKTPTRFYTGHCTGEYAFDLMKQVMGDQLIYVHSGDTVEI